METKRNGELNVAALIDKMELEIVDTASLTPYARNPRINDAAVAAVAASIKSFGFRVPLVIHGADNEIINGHTRWKAANKLGLKRVPCLRADELTQTEIKALRLADNKVSELAKWDEDLLKLEVDDIGDAFDLGEFGFGDLALCGTADEMGQTDPDDAPEAQKVAMSKQGEVYRLGQHLLLCGDSTRREDVSKVAGDGTVDCWLTDPPYNVAYEGANGLTIQNDLMEDSMFREFLRNAFGCAEKAMKPGAAFYIFHGDVEGYNFRGACHDIGLRVHECLVWKKNALVLGRKDYQCIHEPCLYGWKDGEAHNWYGDRAQTTVMEFNKPKRNDVHPTMKPVEMLVYLIKNSTKRGDVVLDTFGGSGSTLIACEQIGRKCRTMEIDPKYCDVIRRRWAEFVHGEGCDWKKLTPKVAD